MASREQDGLDVLEVAGDVDMQSAAQLTRGLTTLIGHGSKSVLLDLTRVAFMDSTGLSALVSAHGDATKAGAHIALIVSDTNLSRLLRITALDTAFATYADLDSAVTAARARD